MDGSLLFDTSVVVDLFKQRPYAQRAVTAAGAVFVTTTTVGELYFGCEQSRMRALTESQVETFITNTRVLPVDRETARSYGKMKAELWKRGKPIPENDLWIAAAAVRHGLPLVTLDKHFLNVPGLHLFTP